MLFSYMVQQWGLGLTVRLGICKWGFECVYGFEINCCPHEFDDYLASCDMNFQLVCHGHIIVVALGVLFPTPMRAIFLMQNLRACHQFVTSRLCFLHMDVCLHYDCVFLWVCLLRGSMAHELDG